MAREISRWLVSMSALLVSLQTMRFLTSRASCLTSLQHYQRGVTSLNRRADAFNPPRNVLYVQTFRTVQGGKLSLLLLIQQKTQVTHIYLSAMHINSGPGDINLNDRSPNDTMYDSIWEESAQLQSSGVKVMMMLGGAAPGSYPRLCSGGNGSIIVRGGDSAINVFANKCPERRFLYATVL